MTVSVGVRFYTKGAVSKQKGKEMTMKRKQKKRKPPSSATEAIKGGYQATIGNYTVMLSKQNGNEFVEVADGESRIAWEYLGTSATVFGKGTNDAPGKKRSAKPKSYRLTPKIMDLSEDGCVVYENAEGDIDLDYSLASGGIKENIVVKEKSDIYHYYFALHVLNFVMKTAENGDVIEFYKPEALKETYEPASPDFVMKKPFMYDTTGGKSDAVHYSIECIGDGEYIFSIQADAEWINASDRIFPVYIDPQLSTSESSCELKRPYFR